MKTGPREDLSGQRFGRLVVLSLATEKTTAGRSYSWHVQCDCGSKKTVYGTSLRTGRTNSCGCLYVESGARMGLAGTTHGHSTLRSGKTPTYRSWSSMLQRCRDKAAANYASYGGAGISVCERWADFSKFLMDMGERPAGTTLDRYPNGEGNYEPGNCRWATKLEQSLNRYTTVWVEIDGKRMCLKEWARHYGIAPSSVRRRVSRGFSLVAAITTPHKQPSQRPTRATKEPKS